MKKIISCFCFLSAILCLAGFAFGGPIHDAAKKGNVAKIKLLLNKNINLLSEKDEIGRTPLHYVAARGRIEALNLLLDLYHADVNVTNNIGATPLHAAAYQSQPECVEILLKHGAFVNARTTRNNATPLHFVVYNGNRPGSTQTVKILIENGADLNAETKKGSTPLGMAIYKKSSEIVELLKEYKAKLSVAERNKSTMRSDASYYNLDGKSMETSFDRQAE
ncbi:MAG: ankyrin repeat domain-containing protein [Candidatus Omnitrophica bacterium]|nr:ankyrin repeat domain-containing protein [Candidatus Omnitrophota bacterium]